jgi:hypothetical protein
MEAAITDKGSQFALHPGATAYYQDTEKSFLDQYGEGSTSSPWCSAGSGQPSRPSSVHFRSRQPVLSCSERAVGQEAFAVIRDAMRDKDMVALARVVLAKRERVPVIFAYRVLI